MGNCFLPERALLIKRKEEIIQCDICGEYIGNVVPPSLFYLRKCIRHKVLVEEHYKSHIIV